MTYCNNPNCIYQDPHRETYRDRQWWRLCTKPMPNVAEAFCTDCSQRCTEKIFEKL